MKNNEKIKELSNIIKNARKYSLIGEYGNSLEKYQEAIEIIKGRQKELEIIKECEDLKEKWKMTEYNIKSEMLQIKDILEKCLQLHHSDFNYSKKQLEGNDFINENKKLMEKEIMEMYNKDKRIYDKASDNNYINKKYSLSNKIKQKSAKTSNFNIVLDSKRNRIPKMNQWPGNKNYFYSKYNKTSNIISNINDNNNNFNIKKCKSLKANMEKKMFNPLEEFYGLKPDNNINSKEFKINGNDYPTKHRKSEVIQQKIYIQKYSPYSTNMKQSSDNQNDNLMKAMQNKINDKKINKIKVVQIDLEGKSKKIDDNIDTIEQALNNLSRFNIDNNDDSF